MNKLIYSRRVVFEDCELSNISNIQSMLMNRSRSYYLDYY